MQRLLIATALCLSTSFAYAQQPSCKMRASEQKLAGAAKNSFMKKCASDAKKACEVDTQQKKLSGAAKNSHMKKCVTDAVGT